VAVGGEQVTTRRTTQTVTQQEGGPARVKFHSKPPPSIKGRTDGGVRNSIQTVDLSTETWFIQMRSYIISDSRPPPPPLVKAKTTEGVQNWTLSVNLSAWITTVQICTLFKLNVPEPC
jgi:hypothetical protein